MHDSMKQGNLFLDEALLEISNNERTLQINMSNELIENWQKKLYNFQSSIFKQSNENLNQGSLFESLNTSLDNNFDPLKLSPLPLSFWRWPSQPHDGASIYLVMDKPEKLNSNIILYIGETISSEKRWKGEHDCKSYLASYTEALSFAGLRSQLSIRFWKDVPKGTKPRRRLEQFLIQKWLPPFNKETRDRWQTPFTSEI